MSSPGSLQPGLPSPGLLSSNNPFRNRAASPASVDAAFLAPSPVTSPFDDPAPKPQQRPLSRNPFLDQPPSQPLKSPGAMSDKSQQHKSLSAEDIFDSLTLDDQMANDKLPPPLAAERRPAVRPSEPASGDAQRPSSKHRPTKSQEEALRARKPPQGTRPGASRSPQRKPPQRRPRRNSDSSTMDFNAQPITPEELKMIEQKRLRDRQRREKEARGSQEGQEKREGRERREPRSSREPKDGREKERDGKSRGRPARPGRRLDIIDQLDATSIYGTGLFHHDGPFDALNPHRNRQNSRRAPMQAFPKDSLNNSLGGAGPLNNNPDHATFMGNGTDEAFRDYAGRAKGRSSEPQIFDPIARGTMVHGDESYGLGTSTFLEGTPAARAAIARTQAEQQQDFVEGGLQRKKSLAQRIRSINKGPRDLGPSGRLTNPDGVSSRQPPDPMPLASSVGAEPNPFFAEFKKGEDSISVQPRDGPRSPASPPAIPRRMSGSALERRATTDATMQGSESPTAKPTGILGRMKSLKGGRRPKNTETDAQPAPPGMAL